MATDNTCKLLALPVELRLQIYDDVLSPVSTVGEYEIKKRTIVALLSTCRQIFGEAIPQCRATLHKEFAGVRARIEILALLLDHSKFHTALPLLESHLDPDFKEFCLRHLRLEECQPRTRHYWNSRRWLRITWQELNTIRWILKSLLRILNHGETSALERLNKL